MQNYQKDNVEAVQLLYRQTLRKGMLQSNLRGILFAPVPPRPEVPLFPKLPCSAIQIIDIWEQIFTWIFSRYDRATEHICLLHAVVSEIIQETLHGKYRAFR